MEEIKKVLSIDMDYLVPDCIQLYNDLAGHERMRQGNYWENVYRERNCERFLSVDDNQLGLVRALLEKNAPNIPAENIMFAEEHDMILELLCSDAEKKDELLEVFNLDHHHDIYYENGKTLVDLYQSANIGNWVYYLGANGKLLRYNWVRNYSSCRFEESMQEFDFIVDQDSIFENLDVLLEQDFDYIFVCLSKDYFPDIFWDIFDDLRMMVEEIKEQEINVWDKAYCEGGKTRFIAGKGPSK